MRKDLGFSRLAYIGDSLTDSGELYRLTSTGLGIGLPPSPPYAKHFSNGPVYADLVPDLLGVFGSKLNFAVGGAEVLPNETVVEKFAGKGFADFLASVSFGKGKEALQTKIDVEGQIDRLLAATEGTDRSTLGVSLMAGVNDVVNVYKELGLEEARKQAPVLVPELVNALIGDVTRLFEKGVGTVILNLLPAGDLFPLIKADGAAVMALGASVVAQINDGLRAAAEALPARYDLRIVDMGVIAREASEDPSTYGFRLVDTPLYKGIGNDLIPLRDPASFGVPEDQAMFFDQVHPTREFHEIWGVYQAEALTSNVTAGSDRADTMTLTAADDLVLGLKGDDVIKAGGGDDVVLAGIGRDTVDGGAGSDILSGGSGDDLVNGGSGDDLIAGGSGNDRLYGDAGNDFLIDGDGSDFVSGGAGNDIFLFTQAELMGGKSDDRDVIDGGDGFDTLVLRLDDGMLTFATLNQWFGGSPKAVLDKLGISATGIEDIRFVGYDKLPSGLTMPSPDLQARLGEAELWNFV